MAGPYGPFAPAQIDFSWLTELPDQFEKGALYSRQRNLRNTLAKTDPNDHQAMAKALLQADPVLGTRYAQAMAEQQATQAYRQADLGLRRDALNQPPDAVRAAQAFAENPALSAARPQSPQMLKAQRDIAAQQKGKENLSSILGKATDMVNELYEGGGMTSPENNPASNLGAYVGSSEYGQKVGAALGTENQSKRKQLLNMRTIISNLVRQASGMSARAFDSNYELQTYLNSIADPQADRFANLVAIDVLDQTFGLGGLLDQKLPQDVLVKVRGAAAEEIKQKPINVDETDLEAGGGGNPQVAPATLPGELDVQDQPLSGPQGAPMDRPLSPGMVVGGFRFKGGNPNDPNSWEQAQ